MTKTCSTPDMAQFQERIRSTRKARNMSLQDVADASGFTKSHVWELERGRSRNPTVRAVWSLANALGVSPAWLLGLDTGGVVIASGRAENCASKWRKPSRGAAQTEILIPQEAQVTETCSTCRFFKLPDRYCRRYPPTGSLTFNGFARFPRLDSTAWCGEHQPKEGGHG